MDPDFGTRGSIGAQLAQAAVEHRGRGLGLPARSQAQHDPQIMGKLLEAAGVQPALRLLVEAAQGGRSWGLQRQGAPVLTMKRRRLNTSRNGWSRWPALSGNNVK